MPLDLGSAFLQLDSVAEELGRSREEWHDRLRTFLESAESVADSTAQAKTRYDPNRHFLAAQVTGTLLGAYPPAELPTDWSVASVDGSHIDVDRHVPLSCYVVNLGGCVLTYGSSPDAVFFSRPRVAHQHDDLFLVDPANPANEEMVTGPVLGLMRTVQELERLAQLVEELPGTTPVLALVDGSLVLWGLSGRGHQPFVRRAIIDDRLVAILDRFREASRVRPVCLAAYVSFPRSAEVVNAVRSCLCPYELAQCRYTCGNSRSARPPCDLANGFLDRDLFQGFLEQGWRSPVYMTNSSVPRENYGEHQVAFFYLHCGQEIARVEMPQWAARDERLMSLTHSMVLDQCRRGQGVPGGDIGGPRTGGHQRRRPAAVPRNGGAGTGPPGCYYLHLGEGAGQAHSLVVILATGPQVPRPYWRIVRAMDSRLRGNDGKKVRRE